MAAAGDAATPYRDFSYPPHSILLMGSEQKGLSEVQVAACDGAVSIPMAGTVDSLNLGGGNGRYPLRDVLPAANSRPVNATLRRCLPLVFLHVYAAYWGQWSPPPIE
ncbi:MAG: hypothetical protein M5U34_02180 [Chloroflexi bacterium]|nr:hypothetical protein [Chloroflexota bacterium]